jgi:amino acid transporter
MNVIYAKLFWILIAVILVLLFIFIPAIGYLFKDNPELSFSIQKSLGIIFLVIIFILIIMIIYFTIIKFDTEAYLKSQGFKGSEKEKEIAKRFFGDWTVKIALLLLTIVGLWFPLEVGYPGSFIALRRYFNVFIIHAIIIVMCTILIYLRYKKYKTEAEESKDV